MGRTVETSIDLVKGVEPEMGYGAIMKVSEVESEMRDPGLVSRDVPLRMTHMGYRPLFDCRMVIRSIRGRKARFLRAYGRRFE